METMFNKALRIMREAFSGKFDKGGEPYEKHPLAVAMSFDSEHQDERTVSILHDLLEDCPDEWNEEKLRFYFPNRIVDAVVCLTKIKGEHYPSYIVRVKSNHLAISVKIKDLEHNMDVRRLPVLTDYDLKRLRKYHSTWIDLMKLKKQLNLN